MKIAKIAKIAKIVNRGHIGIIEKSVLSQEPKEKGNFRELLRKVCLSIIPNYS